MTDPRLSEPLTIYECPDHGVQVLEDGWRYCMETNVLGGACTQFLVEVRVFREEELVTDDFIQQAYFPLGPDDRSLIPIARENMRRALASCGKP